MQGAQRRQASKTDAAVLATLDEAVQRLPKSHREAVLLRYLEGLSVEATAERLGVSASAAGKRATRGIKQLQATFADHGYTMPTAAVGAILLDQAAQQAPAAIVTQTAGVAATTAVAATSTKLLAALAVAGTLLVAGIVTAVAVVQAKSPTPPVTNTVATVLPTPPVEAEADVPGKVRLAYFALAAEIDFLRKIENVTQSTEHPDVRTGTTTDVFAVVRNALSAEENTDSGSANPPILQLDEVFEINNFADLPSVSQPLNQLWVNADRNGYVYTFGFTPPETLNILPGMTGTVRGTYRVSGGEGSEARVAVPLAAVGADGDARFAWVVDPETMTVSRRELVLGRGIGETVPVLEGLEAGETIVGAGMSYLHEGMRIRAYEP